MKFRIFVAALVLAGTSIPLGGIANIESPAFAKRSASKLALKPGEFSGGTYQLNLRRKVRVKVGGAVREFSMEQINHDQKVGIHKISKEDFQKLKAAMPKKLTFKVNPRKLGALQQISVSTNSQSPKKGLYNWHQRQFLFAKLEKPVKSPNGKVGVIKGTSLKGKISKNQLRIKKGEFTSGFIVGAKGAVFGAEATFFFNGTRL